MKALASFTLALAALAPPCAPAAPFVPRSGAQVLETLPQRADAALYRQRAQLAAAPRDPQHVAALAQRYIELGRASSDPRYFGQAQALLSPWWSGAAPPPPIRLLRATLLQSNHRFREAMHDLAAVTAAEPANAQAWLTLATIQVVQGEFSAAVRSCGRLSGLASELAGIACLANARAANGQLAASERLLALALARATPDVQQVGGEGVRVWAMTLLGELAARRGDAAAAEARFRQALALAPHDSYLLGAYADLLLEQRRHAEVQLLLRGQRHIDSLLLRFALASAPASSSVAELQARFDAALRRGDATHQREQARFELRLRRNPQAALKLALANWQVQKETADLRILLESAVAARAPAAVREALAWRRQHGMEDRAIDALVRALEGGPA
ncbi:hypothetical protein [Pseudoduganella sp.]|uniref:hypothetical protein n=1 Tax=Pseudoduganella sp. TaxID=1880898 RepID=UPI0035B2D8E9